MVVIVVAIVIVGGFAFGVLAADFGVGVRPSPNRLRVSGARVPGSWFGGFVFRVRLCAKSVRFGVWIVRGFGCAPYLARFVTPERLSEFRR